MSEKTRDELALVDELEAALDRTSPGEANLLSFVIPEDIGRHFHEQGWSSAERAAQLVQLARGEVEGMRPADQLAAIAYCDKIIQDALRTGGHIHEATHRRSIVDGEVKYQTDIKVMRMTGANTAQPSGETSANPEEHPEEDPAPQDQPGPPAPGTGGPEDNTTAGER